MDGLKKFEEISVSQLPEVLGRFSVCEERAVCVESTAGFEPAPGYKAVWNRTKDCLEAVVSKRYRLIQHSEAFAPIVQALGDAGHSTVKVAGAEWRGNAALYLAIPGLAVRDGDGQLFLGFSVQNNVRAQGALRFQAFGYRSLCSNGMILGMQELAEFRQVHVGEYLSLKVGSLLERLGRSLPEFERAVEAAKADESPAEVKPILALVGFGEKAQKRILWEYSREPATRWGLYNAVTHVGTHYKQGRAGHAYLEKAGELLEQSFSSLQVRVVERALEGVKPLFSIRGV
jgi:hypothetical protein